MRALAAAVVSSMVMLSSIGAQATSGERDKTGRRLNDTQREEQRETKAPFTAVQGAFFAVSVQHLEASARWYVDAFDLQIHSRFSYNGMKGILLAGHGLEVELVAHPGSGAAPDPFDPAKKVLTRGFFKVGFRVADFPSAIAAIRARGVELVAGPFPPRPDARANAMIRDNAGNLIQLFGDFAR